MALGGRTAERTVLPIEKTHFRDRVRELESEIARRDEIESRRRKSEDTVERHRADLFLSMKEEIESLKLQLRELQLAGSSKDRHEDLHDLDSDAVISDKLSNLAKQDAFVTHSRAQPAENEKVVFSQHDQSTQTTDDGSSECQQIHTKGVHSQTEDILVSVEELTIEKCRHVKTRTTLQEVESELDDCKMRLQQQQEQSNQWKIGVKEIVGKHEMRIAELEEDKRNSERCFSQTLAEYQDSLDHFQNCIRQRQEVGASPLPVPTGAWERLLTEWEGDQ